MAKAKEVESYFLIGNTVSDEYPENNNEFVRILDIFKGSQDLWIRCIEKEATKNAKYGLLLEKAKNAGFALPRLPSYYNNIITENGNSGALVYKNNTVYRRIFFSRDEAVALARNMGVAGFWTEKPIAIAALKEPFTKALPHELGHHLWIYMLSDEQRTEWQDLAMQPDTNIDLGDNGLISRIKGYSDNCEKLDEEAFCSYLNAWVCPDAKNLSGAKLVPKIEQFLQQTLQLS